MKTSSRLRELKPLLAKSLLYATGLLTIDTIILLLLTGTVSSTTLTLVLFLEGGVGLLAGVGISLSSTPSITRLGETMCGSSGWSRESQKHAETVGFRWMLVSAIVIVFGFAVSAI